MVCEDSPHVLEIKLVLWSPLMASALPMPMLIIDGSQAFTVRCILNMHQVHGHIQYQVDWKS